MTDTTTPIDRWEDAESLEEMTARVHAEFDAMHAITAILSRFAPRLRSRIVDNAVRHAGGSEEPDW